LPLPRPTDTVIFNISSSLSADYSSRHSIKSECGVGVAAVGNTCRDVLVILVIVPARVATLCPEGCTRDTGGYDVDCDDASLTAVPLIHLKDIRELWLNYNEIMLLENDSFISLTELQ
jgi:hypothetical protein